jgi:hypothetical protein
MNAETPKMPVIPLKIAAGFSAVFWGIFVFGAIDLAIFKISGWNEPWWMGAGAYYSAGVMWLSAMVATLATLYAAWAHRRYLASLNSN